MDTYLVFGGILAYILPCLLAEAFARQWPSQVLQPSPKHAPSVWSTVAVSVVNVFVLGPPFYLSALRQTTRSAAGSLPMQFVGCLLFLDVWFYVTHRLLHRPVLFRSIHRIHHVFVAPRAYAVAFSHPLEYLFHNVAGVISLPFLLPIDDRLFTFWCVGCLVTATCSHSGLAILGARKHDLHHQKFNYNFGVLGIYDYMGGTYLVI